VDRPQLASLRALDNYYMVVLGEVGLVGLGIFLLLCWKICRLVWAPAAGRVVPDGGSRGLCAAMVAACTAFLFLSATFDAWGFSSARIFWVVVALGVSLHDAPESVSPLRPARRP
jgi:hypothetical protein